MSVLACDRSGCPNIMCDRYSYDYGYLCRECFEELVSLGVGTDIRRFMGTDPDHSNASATEAYFNRIFEERR